MGLDKGAINQSKDIELSEGPDLGWLAAAILELRGGKAIRLESLKKKKKKLIMGPLDFSPLHILRFRLLHRNTKCWRATIHIVSLCLLEPRQPKEPCVDGTTLSMLYDIHTACKIKPPLALTFILFFYFHFRPQTAPTTPPLFLITNSYLSSVYINNILAHFGNFTPQIF
jgi:hypothetical protein